MVSVYVFSPFRSTRDTSDNFLTLSSRVRSCLLQCKSPQTFQFLVLYQKGSFERDNLGYFHANEWIQFGCKGIYYYRYIMQNVEEESLDRVYQINYQQIKADCFIQYHVLLIESQQRLLPQLLALTLKSGWYPFPFDLTIMITCACKQERNMNRQK